MSQKPQMTTMAMDDTPLAQEPGWKNFIRSVPPLIWFFVSILIIFVLMAFFSPYFATTDPNTQSLMARMKVPGSTIRGITYWLGSDELGRDVLSRIVYGARASMSVAFLAVCISGTIGTMLGLLAAYYRGLVESAIMRIVDAVLSIPSLLFAIIVVAVLGPSFINVILILGLTSWPRYARILHGQALGLMNQPYIRYARFVGTSIPRIFLRHLLPNVVGQLVVVATLQFGSMVLLEAGLSFLGLGVQPPTPSWGSMMSIGRHYMDSAWWIAAFPGCCLFLLVLSINITGDFLRDRLDPRLR